MYQGIIRLFKLLFLTLVSSAYVHAQSAFVPLNDDYYHLIDRLEIKRGKFSEGFHFNAKPFERKAVVALTDSILKEGTVDLTDRDWETIDYLREDSWEWTKGMISTDSAKYNKLARLGWFKSPPPGQKRKFFHHPADLYPVFTIQASFDDEIICIYFRSCLPFYDCLIAFVSRYLFNRSANELYRQRRGGTTCHNYIVNFN